MKQQIKQMGKLPKFDPTVLSEETKYEENMIKFNLYQKLLSERKVQEPS